MAKVSPMRTSPRSLGLAGPDCCAMNCARNSPDKETTYPQASICTVKMKWINKRSVPRGSAHRLHPKAWPLRRSPRQNWLGREGRKSSDYSTRSQIKQVCTLSCAWIRHAVRQEWEMLSRCTPLRFPGRQHRSRQFRVLFRHNVRFSAYLAHRQACYRHRPFLVVPVSTSPHTSNIQDLGIHIQPNAGIDNRIVLEKRQDTDGSSQPRPDALHLYGVDLLATHDILAHFSAYNPTFVEWINDSSCNVCFPDEFAVKRVIIQLGEALTAQETTDSGGVLHSPCAVPRCSQRL